jgi:uncharacterized protein YjiK
MIYAVLPLVLFSAPKVQNYNLELPQKIIELPAELTEISALTDVTSDLIACVQDEKGIIYYVSIRENKIMRRDSILPDGDFEGLTYHDSTFYLLRSEGTVFRLNLKNHQLDSIRYTLPAIDNEGLGWHHGSNRLMIASKSAPSLEKGKKDFREIRFLNWSTPDTTYSFFDVDVELIRAKAQFKKIQSGKKTKKGSDKPIQFRPSSLAVQPSSGKIFVLSAQDPMIAVYDPSGMLLDVFAVPTHILPKPEGITFMPDNTMLISSEGKGKSPSIAIFPYIEGK